MCGRVAVHRPVEMLAGWFDARVAAGVRERYEPGYNVAPTRLVPGLVDEGGRVLDLFHWGLANRSFNARSERVSGEARRLAVVVDGFFEWRADGRARRSPVYFRRPDGSPIAIAGLMEGDSACTMVTTSAGPDVADVHHRMPVVLEPDAVGVWLGHDALSRRRLADLLRPAPAGTLVHHPVDPRVGDVRNDAAALIEPFEPPEQPLRLFG